MRKMVCTLVLVALIASPVAAQFGGFGAGNLLQNSGVQKELKLSDKQLDELREAQSAMFKEMISLFKDKEKMAERMKELGEKNRKTTSKILNADQNKRFRQIELQVGGLGSLNTKEVQEELKLSEAHRQKISSLFGDFQKDAKEIMADAGFDQKERMAAVEKTMKLNRDMANKFAKEMNMEQQAKYKEMLGTPFEFKMEMPKFPFPKKKDA